MYLANVAAGEVASILYVEDAPVCHTHILPQIDRLSSPVYQSVLEPNVLPILTVGSDIDIQFVPIPQNPDGYQLPIYCGLPEAPEYVVQTTICLDVVDATLVHTSKAAIVVDVVPIPTFHSINIPFTGGLYDVA